MSETALHMPDEDRARIVQRAQRRINEWNGKHGHGRSGVDPFLAEEHATAVLLRDLVVAIQCLERQRDKDHGALRQFYGCAYPVSTEINSRGWNWRGEGSLDEALAVAAAALGDPQRLFPAATAPE